MKTMFGLSAAEAAPTIAAAMRKPAARLANRVPPRRSLMATTFPSVKFG
jgi:hypothetical protein